MKRSPFGLLDLWQPFKLVIAFTCSWWVSFPAGRVLAIGSTPPVSSLQTTVPTTPTSDPQPPVPLGALVKRSRPMPGYSGDGFASSVEMVATVVLFVLGGVALDRWLGTAPWFAIALAGFSVVGTMAKQWFVYNARMEAQEANLRLARQEAAADAVFQREAAEAALAAERAALADHLASQRPADSLDLDSLGRALA